MLPAPSGAMISNRPTILDSGGQWHVGGLRKPAAWSRSPMSDRKMRGGAVAVAVVAPARAPGVAEDEQAPRVVVADGEHGVAAAQAIVPGRHRQHAGLFAPADRPCSGGRRAPGERLRPGRRGCPRSRAGCGNTRWRATDASPGSRGATGGAGSAAGRTATAAPGTPNLRDGPVAVSQRHRAVGPDHAGQHAFVEVDEQS